MRNLLQRLRQEVLLLDGSMGVMLQNRGLPAGYAPDLWNLERPDIIHEVHREYVKAGSDIILTNTFGASRLRLLGFWGGEKKAEKKKGGSRNARKGGGGKR